MARDRDDYDDGDDRPTRRPGGGADLGPLDKMYRDTNIVILILFGLCCGLIAFILTLVAYFTAKDEKAKSNAMIVLIISGIMTLINIGLTVMNLMAGAAAGAAGAR